MIHIFAFSLSTPHFSCSFSSSHRKPAKGKRGRPKRKAKEEEEDEEVILLEHTFPRTGPSTGRMTLILIEEVDLVFDGKH